MWGNDPRAGVPSTSSKLDSSNRERRGNKKSATRAVPIRASHRYDLCAGSSWEGIVLWEVFKRRSTYDRPQQVLFHDVISNSSDEGFIFADPLIETNEAVDNWITTMFPDAKPSVIKAITDKLYPPAPTSRYWFPFTRLVSLIGGYSRSHDVD